MKSRTFHVICSGVPREVAASALGGIGLELEQVFQAAAEYTFSENWWRPDRSLLVVHADSTFFGCAFLAVTGEPADVAMIRSVIPCDTLHGLIHTARSAADDLDRVNAIYRLGLAYYESSQEGFDLFHQLLTGDRNPVIRRSVLAAFSQHVLPEWYDLAVLATRDQDAKVSRNATAILPLLGVRPALGPPQ